MERCKQKKAAHTHVQTASLRYSLVTIAHPLVKLTKNKHLLETFTVCYEDLKRLFQLVKPELCFEFLVKVFGIFFRSSCYLCIYLTEMPCPPWTV